MLVPRNPGLKDGIPSGFAVTTMCASRLHAINPEAVGDAVGHGVVVVEDVIDARECRPGGEVGPEQVCETESNDVRGIDPGSLKKVVLARDREEMNVHRRGIVRNRERLGEPGSCRQIQETGYHCPATKGQSRVIR